MPKYTIEYLYSTKSAGYLDPYLRKHGVKEFKAQNEAHALKKLYKEHNKKGEIVVIIHEVKLSGV